MFVLLVITLYPASQHAGGWKSENYTKCINNEGDQFFKCIESNTFFNNGNDYNQSSLSAKYIYVGNIYQMYVMGQNLEVRNGAITHIVTESLQIPMDDSVEYMIYILDYKMNFLTYDFDFIPGIVIKREANPGSNVVPIKVYLFI